MGCKALNYKNYVALASLKSLYNLSRFRVGTHCCRCGTLSNCLKLLLMKSLSNVMVYTRDFVLRYYARFSQIKSHIAEEVPDLLDKCTYLGPRLKVRYASGKQRVYDKL